MSTIESVGVIGAGTMGNGIAQACAVAGVRTVMIDVSDAALNKGLDTIGGSLDRLVKKEKLSAADRDAALKRVTTTTDYAALRDVDLIIEAATENAALKFDILRKVDALREARRIARDEHVVDLDHAACRGNVAPRALRRHAFLQPGADDGVGRDHPRAADGGDDRRARRARSRSGWARRRSS